MRLLTPALALLGPIAGVALLISAASPPAVAHGTTIRVAWSGIQPPTVTVRAGAEVHFHNSNSSGSPCTVIFDDGSIESPTLGRAGGWHHVFTEAGTYAYHLKEHPSAKGSVVVVAK
jgi:plastocyanin